MSNVYVGYSPNDFFYQTTKNVVTSDYHPTQQECKNIIENANIYPGNIAGLQLWLDATDSSTIISDINNFVTKWTDKTENKYQFTVNNSNDTGKNAESPKTNGPKINNMNTINFTVMSGNCGLYNDIIHFGNIYTIFVVGYSILPTDKLTTNTRLLNGSSSDNTLFFGGMDGKFATNVGDKTAWATNTKNSPSTSIESACIMAMTNDGTSTGLIPYLNRTKMTAKNGVTVPFNGLYIGNFNNAGINTSDYWNGVVGEILVYDNVLSISDHKKVEDYLAYKWNIVSSLPYLNKKDCTSYFGDNKIECIKSKICLNEQSVNQINSQDVEHNSAYAKNTDNSVEFQDTFLNTVNLSLGILFIVFVIFKIQSIAKK